MERLISCGKFANRGRLPASLTHWRRGYTGHEHLEGLGLIHMKGRVYDPELGRFLSPDPVTQFPASTRGWTTTTTCSTVAEQVRDWRQP